METNRLDAPGPVTADAAPLPEAPRRDSVPLLEVRGVWKHFGGVTALSGASFRVEVAEVVALVGDNGAGKSTAVKIISGIETPDAGSILIDGVGVSPRNPHAANELGIQTVYQDLALCDNLNTIQNLFLGREIRSPWLFGGRLSRARMEGRGRAVLGELGVKIRDLSVPVGNLSGGQRQSVAVCRAVLSDPRIVLLDEPTAALGVAQRGQVLAMIERLRDQGRGVVVVSHDLADVQKVADRVVVFRLGRTVADLTRGSFSRDALVAAITGAAEVEPVSARDSPSGAH